MKVAVIGSRSFDKYSICEKELDALLPKETTHIVSGGARGADQMAEKYATRHLLDIEIYYPDWNKHGKAAGFIRNKQIVEASDMVIAFWDGSSKGTKSSIDYARKFNKPVSIVTI